MKPDYRTFAPAARHDPADTVQQNLAELSERAAVLHRARAFWLGELIAGEISEALPDRDALQTFCEQLILHTDTQPYAAAQHRADLLALCFEIAAAYPRGYEQAFATLFGQFIPPAETAAGRVAYVQNSYTEQAFMELTGFIKQRRVAYFHHFDDVCQEVTSGLCEYGILPVESSSEGLMAGLCRQIELYDLRICALCRIRNAKDGYTSFALVRKTLPPVQPCEQHCLDLLFSPADPTEAGRLITAAALCGHELLHASTFAGRDGEQFRLRLSVNPDALYPFLLYLQLFCADTTPIGLYTIK